MCSQNIYHVLREESVKYDENAERNIQASMHEMHTKVQEKCGRLKFLSATEENI